MTSPLHSYCKHDLLWGFYCWSNLLCVAGVKWGEEGKALMGGGGHDKEVASSKFNTSIQKSIPYLLPKPYPLGPQIPI